MVKVLVIEDNLDIRESTCEILELDGFAVTYAESGEDGLLLAREALPDVIICDIMMRGMGGYTVLSELRRQPHTASIPFIFISAQTETAQVTSGMAMGAAAYLRKPFSEESLVGCINRCIANKV